MKQRTGALNRRAFLAGLGGMALSSPAITGGLPAAARGPALRRTVPSTGETISPVGMGTWITFNVGDDPGLRAQRVKVLQAFFDHGGGMIDSSPMYGSSEEVVGYCLSQLSDTGTLYSATKVWTVSQWLGIRQMKNSRELWGAGPFNLMQIHNLLDWESHLETLLEWKREGRIGSIGVTTSHGRRHDDLERIITTQPIDWVQFTYNILDRRAEKRLLPAARERGLGVIINRPFRRGRLFDIFDRHPLPGWAADIDCENWAQFLLKFIISHPGVTCAIPATSRVDHMNENMGALYGQLPDADMRRRMVRYVESL